MVAYLLFIKIYKTLRPIPWCKEWCDKNSRLPNAVVGKFAPQLMAGDMVSSISNRGRRCIIVGALSGNVVIFARRAKDVVPEIGLCCEDTLKCKPSYNISYKDVVNYIGDGTENGMPNIGIRLKNQLLISQEDSK